VRADVSVDGETVRAAHALAELDELEFELRGLHDVISVGFDDAPDLLVVELQAGPDADDDVARAATRIVDARLTRRAAVEVVRWGDGPPTSRDTRLRLVDVTTDPAVGDIAVYLAHGDDRAVGRAPSAHGLLGVVEAAVYAIRTFVPDLPYLPGWARTIETTPERRFLVVASVTDPETRTHLRGAADGRSPLEAAARATLAALNRSISREL
jgi:hypothetical protein